jgi:hypothetical protein
MNNTYLNDLIIEFVDIFNNDVKQHNKDWYKLMGTTIGGSEVAAIMGLSPHSSFYKVIESKIEICKGTKKWNLSDTLPCWWGTLFENVITQFVEIDLGNTVHGDKICIQKYDGHRNSPDGYIIANFYNKNGIYHIWTTDLPEEMIEISLIMLLEFKCPVTRRVYGDIPKYYKPQVLSGLAVSPIAHKGLFVDSIFKKCCLDQLGNNPDYDTTFHRRTRDTYYPIAWGVIPIYISKTKVMNEQILDIYTRYFNMEYDPCNVIDLGDAELTVFNDTFSLINSHTLLTSKSTIYFADGIRKSDEYDIYQKNNCNLFAVLPWKLFDVSYVIVDREPNFLEDIYPIIQRVHKIVKESLNDDIETIKINNICDIIYD